MPRIHSTRRARFKAACARAGITQTAWAEKQSVTKAHLMAVLANERESERLTTEIDRFVESIEAKVIESVKVAA